MQVIVMPRVFADRLRALREAKGLTQEALARAAGMSTVAVQKIEQKQTDPKLSTLTKLAAALEISASELLRDDEPEAEPDAEPPAKPKKK